MTAPENQDGAGDIAADLFAGTCRFLTGAAGPEGVPAHDYAEVALAGRSNVGKSSLLNALVGRRKLARTSKDPGRTRELNFFLLEGRQDMTVVLADLPGYGFARAPKAVVARWTRLTRHYLAGRPQLRRVFLLIDSRHGLKPADRDVLALLDEAAVSYQIVLTKADKIPAAERPAAREHVAAALHGHPAAHPEILVTSAQTGTGIDALRLEIARLAAGS